MSRSRSFSFAGLTALILGVLLFSTVEVCSKLMQAGGAVAGNNPFWLACFRSVGSGLLLTAPALTSLRARNQSIRLRDAGIFLGIGLIGVTLMLSLFHLGIFYLPANIAALLFSCNPVFVVLFAAVLLSERITLRSVTAIVLCVAGVLVLAHGRSGGISLPGVLLMSGSALAFSLYTVLCKKVIPRYGPLPVTAFAALSGGLIILPIALTVEGLPFASYGMADWAGMTYLTVFGTALGYWLYIYGIGHVGAGAGSMTFFLKPFAAAWFAWLILGETFSVQECIAGALILTGMVTALLPQSRKLSRS